MSVCVCVCVLMHRHICVFLDVCAYMNECVCVCVLACVWACVWVCMCVYFVCVYVLSFVRLVAVFPAKLYGLQLRMAAFSSSRYPTSMSLCLPLSLLILVFFSFLVTLPHVIPS